MVSCIPPLQRCPPAAPDYAPVPPPNLSAASHNIWKTGDTIYVPLLMFGFKRLPEEKIMLVSDTAPQNWYVEGKVLKKYSKVAEVYFECFDARVQKQMKFLEVCQPQLLCIISHITA